MLTIEFCSSYFAVPEAEMIEFVIVLALTYTTISFTKSYVKIV